MKINNNTDKGSERDLLEFLKYILSCTYISDLKFEPYNDKAKTTLGELNLQKYSLKQLKDVFEYIYNKR